MLVATSPAISGVDFHPMKTACMHGKISCWRWSSDEQGATEQARQEQKRADDPLRLEEVLLLYWADQYAGVGN